MLQRFTRKSLSLAVLLASSAASSVAMAQLEEVVVTAQKREQSLQDVPIAVSTFNQVEIDTRRISNVKDLALFVPNMQITDSPSGTSGATIAIRGASTINPAVTWEPVVGMYLDGVFLGKNLGGIFEIAELERVEVLRGPQGTLYGKNTVGGAINMITRLPSEEFEGQANVSVGNEGYTQGKLRIDSGTWGKFRASAAYLYSERDGFYDNVDLDPTGGQNPFVNPRSSKDFNNLDSEVWRIDTIFDATDTFRARYSYDSSKRNQQPSKGQLTDVSQAAFDAQGLGPLGQTLNLYTLSKNDNANKISNDFSLYEDSDTSGHGLYLDWDAGEWGAMGDVSLKSISAYRELDYNDLADMDGSPMDLFHSGRNIDYDQFSQEIQLLGSTDTVDYVMGLYYFEENGDVKNPITFFGLFGSPTDNNLYGLNNDSMAAYGQAEWNPASVQPLTLTLGIRYTEEERDQYITHPNTSSGGVGAFDEEDSDTWTNTSGTFVAGWDFNDDINVYAKVAQGWKSGGFNGEAPTAEAFLEGYDPEEVLAYELGLKSRLMDDKIQLNIAAFYNDISDMQVSVFLEGSGGAASNVQNAGNVTTQGFEVELVYQVIEALRLSANYGYLDSKYDEFIENGVDVKNQKDIPYAPENMASLALDWSIGTWGWGNLDLHMDWSYNDSYVPYIEPSQNATSEIDSYSVLNANLMLSEVQVGSDMTMQFSLWGKNLTDEDYRQNTIPFGLWTVSYFGDPITYGMDVRLNF
ncbi:MAG: TonB-dependent receptor [Halioglobus sp.]|nr:TonB-dependent receptor [Halioglobus sp.]